MLYDVSTLYFETDQGDGFRGPGFSKERRLEPQITLGLLTDGAGFPSMVEAFEGNRAETKTMLQVIEAFMAAHQLANVTIVADAGIMSDANQNAIEDARLSPILGTRIPDVPYAVKKMARQAPGRGRPRRARVHAARPPKPRRPRVTATRSSTTNTGMTGPAARCAASTNKSPRPRTPSPVRWR